MAICCEFIDIIIPIEVINRCYKGGYKQYIEDRGGLCGCEWDDGILYRNGSMGGDVELRLEMWHKLGLVGWNGEKWVDYCISSEIYRSACFSGFEEFLDKPSDRTCDWFATYRYIGYHIPYTKPEKPEVFPAWQGALYFETEEYWEEFQQALLDKNPEEAFNVFYQAARNKDDSKKEKKISFWKKLGFKKHK